MDKMGLAGIDFIKLDMIQEVKQKMAKLKEKKQNNKRKRSRSRSKSKNRSSSSSSDDGASEIIKNLNSTKYLLPKGLRDEQD